VHGKTNLDQENLGRANLGSGNLEDKDPAAGM